MKRKLFVLFSIGLLLLCTCVGGQRAAAAEPRVLYLFATRTRRVELRLLEPWEFQTDPMAICNLFPDRHFAESVAQVLGLEVVEVVSFEQLAGYTGGLHIMPANELESLEGIGHLTGLTAFSCYKNNLRELPAEFGRLVNLEHLQLYKAFALERIPPEIGGLQRLKYMRLSQTQLKEVPPEIGQLKNLEILYLDNTRITQLPEEIGQLESLLLLDLHGNALEEVPESIGDLAELRMLDLSYTNLTAIPEQIGKLTHLRRLNLFGCDLTRLPDSLRNCGELQYLNVYDNYNLNETYKQWFDPQVYTCQNDPLQEPYWQQRQYE